MIILRVDYDELNPGECWYFASTHASIHDVGTMFCYLGQNLPAIDSPHTLAGRLPRTTCATLTTGNTDTMSTAMSIDLRSGVSSVAQRKL